MAQDLRDLFARELDAEAPPPVGDLVQVAVHQGTRIRRRRHLMTFGGIAASVVAVAIGAALTPPTASDVAAGVAPADPAYCPTQTPTRAAAGSAGDGNPLNDVSIFLPDDVTAAQRTGLDAALRSHALVASVDYEDHEQAYSRFRDLYPDNPELLDAVEPDHLPESFRVKLKDPQSYEAFVAEFRDWRGVDEIVDVRGLCQTLVTWEGP